MVMVRDIPRNEIPSERAYVVIEFAGGRFVANGFKVGQHGIYWTPAAFDTLDQAIEASVEWATENGVAAVYVRGIRGRGGVSS
jgi:hypothetical protein